MDRIFECADSTSRTDRSSVTATNESIATRLLKPKTYDGDTRRVRGGNEYGRRKIRYDVRIATKNFKRSE